MHSYGTVHHLTCPGTSQQNGRAKRKFRHILDIVRALLLSAKVPAHFLGEAALHAVYAINRIPSPVIQNQTSYELMSPEKSLRSSINMDNLVSLTNQKM